MNKENGTITDLLSVGMCILALTTVMMAFLNCTSLVAQKQTVCQLTRKYILRMETVGYLTAADETALLEELNAAGVTDCDFRGSTMTRIGYGTPLTLYVRGKLGGEYAFEEKRVSTAKH